jgi:hypothetical protein
MKKFQRKIEDFVCENCRHEVSGTGYTNHCPKCLFSKHVDLNPGDRQEICQGLMKPIGFKLTHGEYIILHKCLSCGKLKKNKASVEDDLDQIIKLPSAA